MKKTVQVLLLVSIALFLAYSLSKNIFSFKDKVGFYEELQSEHNEEKELNKQLKSDLKKSSDYYYIERQIRDKLNLLQADEVSIIIPVITPSPTPAPSVDKKPYEQWFDLLIRQ